MSRARVRSGELRQRADLQAKARTPNGSGGSTITWTTERKVWCEFLSLTGAQRIEAMHQKSKVTHQLRVRYATDITPSKRLLFRGVAYSIEAVWDPDNRREYLHVVAASGEAT